MPRAHLPRTQLFVRHHAASALIAASALPFGVAGALAQPVWSLDVAGANQSLTLYSTARATLNGGTSCAELAVVPNAATNFALQPAFVFGSETYDFGAAAFIATQALGSGTVNASCTSMVGLIGLGTNQVIITFRTSTLHSAAATTCAFIAEGHTEVTASLPLLIVGEAALSTHSISYQYEYSVNAVSPGERTIPWPEDGIICSGGVELGCPIEAQRSLFNTAYATGYPPERTSTPVIGSGTLIVSPGWSGGGVYPERLPIIYASLGSTIDDIMPSPAPIATPDISAGEFAVRLTLTIGPALASGACCRTLDCLITSPNACATTFGGQYRGDSTACINPTNHQHTCCPADFNGYGGPSIQDLFDFLGAYFAGLTEADFYGSRVISVQDIFDYLAAYFAGC